MKAGQFELIRVREQRGSDARYLREILEDIKAGRAPADAFIP